MGARGDPRGAGKTTDGKGIGMRDLNAAIALAKMFVRRLEQGDVSMAIEFGQAALAETIAQMPPVLPAKSTVRQ